MKNKENDPRYNAEGKIIVDRAQIEKKVRRSIILYAVAAAVTLITVVIPLYFLLRIRQQINVLHAVQNGTFSVVENLVTDKEYTSDFYMGSDSDEMKERKTYYVTDVLYGKQRVSQDEYSVRTVGEPYWFVSIPEKDHIRIIANYGSNTYCLAEELTPFLEPLAESAKTEARQELATREANRKAAILAQNEKRAARSKRPKAVCPTCCKIYDVQKHPDACPDCGTARVI